MSEIEFIFSAGGEPVGFAKGRGIYDLSGGQIGQLRGLHVHSSKGRYVGELHNGMVVDKNMGDYGNVGSIAGRGSVEHIGIPPRNRGAARGYYTDVWSRLFWDLQF